jgi:hypothetical protein
VCAVPLSGLLAERYELLSKNVSCCPAAREGLHLLESEDVAVQHVHCCPRGLELLSLEWK